MSEAQPQLSTSPRVRWRFLLAPEHLVIALITIEVLLWLSERSLWFPFSRNRGFTVLIAVATVGAFCLVMLVWFAASLLFRLRFQFNIRSLLALMLAVAIPSSWFVVKMREAERQKKATEAILKLKGFVGYDYEYDPLVRPSMKPPGPPWLRRLVGPDFLDCVTHVRLPGDDDAELEPLQDLPDLLAVWTTGVSACKYTDAGLARLEGHSRLLRLLIGAPAASLTDDGLAHLERLQRLTTLGLDGPKISDAGLKHLEGLSELEHLELAGAGITDAGLVHLQSLRKLKKLVLSCTISDEGMKHLAPLVNLTVLQSYAPVPDQLKDKAFNKLRGITPLEFEGTPLIDVLEYLQDSNKLKFKIDEAALQEAKIDRSVEITFNRRGINLQSALDPLLEPLGLVWQIGPRGVIIITSKAAYAKRHPNLLRLKQSLPNLKEVYVDW
jgi:hypothetical protein